MIRSASVFSAIRPCIRMNAATDVLRESARLEPAREPMAEPVIWNAAYRACQALGSRRAARRDLDAARTPNRCHGNACRAWTSRLQPTRRVNSTDCQRSAGVPTVLRRPKSACMTDTEATCGRSRRWGGTGVVELDRLRSKGNESSLTWRIETTQSMAGRLFKIAQNHTAAHSSH